MSEAIKPTPGPWRIDTFLGCLTGADSKVIGGHADLTLCAEAGTVFHETQCTPRQLVERVQELEGALRAYESARAGLFSHTLSNGVFNAWGKAYDCSALNAAHLQARAALSKALPNAAAKEAGK